MKELKLKGWLEHNLSKKELNKSKLSRMLGKCDTYLQALALKGDFSGTQLVALGNYLDTNPFEPYFPLLHHLARPTRTEREQAIKIAELEAQLLALEKERDWLKEVVMRK